MHRVLLLLLLLAACTGRSPARPVELFVPGSQQLLEPAAYAMLQVQPSLPSYVSEGRLALYELLPCPDRRCPRQAARRAVLQAPGGDPLPFVLRQHLVNRDGSQTWIGRYTHGPGELILTATDHGMYGIAWLADRALVIEGTGHPERAFLLEFFRKSHPDHVPGATDVDHIAYLEPVDAPGGPMPRPAETVDLLVAYTRQAARDRGDGPDQDDHIRAWAWTQLHATNRILHRSGLDGVAFDIVGFAELQSVGPADPWDPSAPDHVPAIYDRGRHQFARDQRLGRLPWRPTPHGFRQLWASDASRERRTGLTLQELRERHGADVAAVLTATTFHLFGRSSTVRVPTLGTRGGPPPGAPVLFQMSTSHRASLRWTFAHELGHITGLRHGNGEEPVRAHHPGQGWSSERIRSLMQTHPRTAVRIPVLSSGSVRVPASFPPPRRRPQGPFPPAPADTLPLGDPTHDAAAYLRGRRDPTTGRPSDAPDALTPLQMLGRYRALPTVPVEQADTARTR